MQVLRLGENLPEMELLLPRGGATAFALDMTEPDGGPTNVLGSVEVVVDSSPTFVVAGTPETIWVVNNEDTLPDGSPVQSTTPGAEAVTRVMFLVTADQTLSLAAGPHRGGLRYTVEGVGPVLLAKGVVTVQ